MAIEFEDEFMEDAEFAALEAVQNLSCYWIVLDAAKRLESCLLRGAMV